MGGARGSLSLGLSPKSHPPLDAPERKETFEPPERKETEPPERKETEHAANPPATAPATPAATPAATPPAISPATPPATPAAIALRGAVGEHRDGGVAAAGVPATSAGARGSVTMAPGGSISAVRARSIVAVGGGSIAAPLDAGAAPAAAARSAMGWSAATSGAKSRDTPEGVKCPETLHPTAPRRAQPLAVWLRNEINA